MLDLKMTGFLIAFPNNNPKNVIYYKNDFKIIEKRCEPCCVYKIFLFTKVNDYIETSSKVMFLL